MSDRNSLIEMELPRLRRFAWALTRDPDWADDLVQDCIERALSRWSSWRGDGSLRAWLFAILHNLFANGARRRGRFRALFRSDGEVPESSTPATQQSSMGLRDLDLALQQLPPEQRQVVLLVGVEGFSYAEVATIIGSPIGTVMSRLSRGRERLRGLLATDEAGGGPVLRRIK
ncbi:MAG: RNA polymerase sigma factor [Inquilinus sp.]|nr:RNA polymerase sigma factor [Inquilinus sp.]